MIIRYPPSVAAPAPHGLFNLCQEIASILLFLATCYNQALFAQSLYPFQGLSSFYSSPPVTTRLFFPIAFISYPRSYPSFPRHLSQLGSFSHSLYPVQEPILLFLTTTCHNPAVGKKIQIGAEVVKIGAKIRPAQH